MFCSKLVTVQLPIVLIHMVRFNFTSWINIQLTTSELA
jgi:hypothetical protein